MNLRRLLAYASLYLLWGGTYLAVRMVVLVTPPFGAAAFRFVLASLVLLWAGRLLRKPGESWPSRQEWWDSAKLGLLMFAVNYACFFWAEQRLYSGIAAVIVATMPVWVFLIEALLVRTKRPTPASFAGALLGIAGVLLLTWQSHPSPSSHAPNTPAVLILLAGTICWGAGSLWSRSLVLPSNQFIRAALQMGLGGGFLALLALGAGEWHTTIHALAHWSRLIWFCFAYMVAASVIAFSAYVWLLHHEPASRVTSYAYVNPLVAIGLGAALGNEHFAALQILGAALVISGVVATLWTPSRERTS